MKKLIKATFENLKQSFYTNKIQNSSFPFNQEGMSKKQLSSIKGGEDVDIVIADIIGG